MLPLPNKGIEMEHRQAHREIVNLPVVLKMRDEVLRYGWFNNLSKEGASIVINGSAVTRGSIVEVKFRSLPSTASKQKDSVRGYLVWAEGNKIGLLWVAENVKWPF